jgi:ligand-binding sensor domain-containing protein
MIDNRPGHDKPGNVWVATQSGLEKLERQTNKFIHITQRQYLRTNLSNNFISTITIDEDDNLWLVTSAPGLDYFNTRTAKLIQHFNFGSSIDPVEDWNIHPYGANTGRNGNIWIGSRTNGLYCYNTRSGKTTHFVHEKKNIYSISSNGVYKIMKIAMGIYGWQPMGIIDYYEKIRKILYRLCRN